MATPRRKDGFRAERVLIPFTHEQVTADTTPAPIYKVPAGRTLEIARVLYQNPTGLAEDAANFFNLKFHDGTPANVAANWSTETGQQGTLTAATFVEFVIATNANKALAAGDVLTLFLDETGTATLPAGFGVVEGYLL